MSYPIHIHRCGGCGGWGSTSSWHRIEWDTVVVDVEIVDMCGAVVLCIVVVGAGVVVVVGVDGVFVVVADAVRVPCTCYQQTITPAAFS